MSREQSIIQLYAGTRPDGEPVYEKVAVAGLDDNNYQILHSPGFVRGLGRGDVFSLVSRQSGTFVVVRRSGNIAVRVYSKVPSATLDTVLTPQVVQLEGRRDVMSEFLLVYSLPLEAGFDNIESTFEQVLSGNADASWNYGNVYHEHTGEPINWWLQNPDAPRERP